MSGLVPLNALRAFEATARRGGFVAAADELHVTPAAVGQQVRQLEALIGAPLFEREGRKLVLTERGAQALQPLRRGFELMGEASAALKAKDVSPRITVSAPPELMTAWLAKDLARWDSPVHVLPEGRDADLRVFVSTAGSTHPGAEPLMDEILTPLAAPALLTQGEGFDVLERLALIEDATAALGWSDWLAARGGYGLDIQPQYRCEDSLAAIALAEMNAGIVLARKPLAYDAIRAGRLTPVYANGDVRVGRCYYLAPALGREMSGRLARLARFLKTCAAERQDLAGEL